MPVLHARGALGSAGSSIQCQRPRCRLTEHRTLQWNYQNVKEIFEYALLTFPKKLFRRDIRLAPT